MAGGREGWREGGLLRGWRAGGGRVEDHGRGEAAFEGRGTAGQGPSERWATHAQPAPHPAPHPAPLGPAGSTSTHPDGNASHSLGARSSSSSEQRRRQQAGAAAGAAAGRAHRLGGDQKRAPVEVLASSGKVKTSCGRGRAHTHRGAARINESGFDRSNPKMSGRKGSRRPGPRRPRGRRSSAAAAGGRVAGRASGRRARRRRNAAGIPDPPRRMKRVAARCGAAAASHHTCAMRS